MRILTRVGLAALPLMLSFNAMAMDYSEPVLCASTDVHECVDGTSCKRVLPEQVGAPTFFRVDLENKVIRVSKSGEPSKIEHIGQLPGRLVLQGVDAGKPELKAGTGWTVMIEDDTGRFVGTASTRQAAIVIFGACTEI